MSKTIMARFKLVRCRQGLLSGILTLAVMALMTMTTTITGPALAQDAEVESTDPADPNLTYLEEFQQREGVIARPSGLLIRIIDFKEGDIPGPGSSVVVHYEGKLVDGTVFDSSYARGEPAEFPVDGVIRGWTEALMLMQTGSKWEIVVPSDIAYGDEGRGEGIPGGATLIFTVELLAVI